MSLSPPFWLASASPRRRLMLREAGVEFQVRPADIDDGRLAPGCTSPEAWVMALAYLKARRVADMLINRSAGQVSGTVIGADTICVHDGEILGQPRDADHARAMIERMRSQTHITMTGVALLSIRADSVPSRRTASRFDRMLFFDRTRVIVGHISDEAIDLYVAGGDWRGKAGAYNLSERINEGWPIQVDGDPTTVMGLPMQRLLPLIGQSREATA